MAGNSFAAIVREFGEKALARADDIFAESVQDVIEVAQRPVAQGGRMPVDTGALRISLVSELNGAEVAKGPESFTMVIADLKMGDTCAFAWTAAYALRLEFGFVGEDSLGRTYNVEGRHFAGSAAAQWPNFVAKNAAKVAQG